MRCVEFQQASLVLPTADNALSPQADNMWHRVEVRQGIRRYATQIPGHVVPR